MKDTFTYSGDHEYATWRKGVECAVCRINGGEPTEAVGVIIDAALIIGDGGNYVNTIQVTPACEDCADGLRTAFIPFFEEDK